MSSLNLYTVIPGNFRVPLIREFCKINDHEYSIPVSNTVFSSSTNKNAKIKHVKISS